MCKLIRTKSGVLNLILETQYVSEVFRRTTPQADEEESRPAVLLTSAR